MNFKLIPKYRPTGDQPRATQQFTDDIHRGDPAQVLLGVTGSSKTFTMASVTNSVQVPALILSYNKTLAAQLYEEIKGPFPEDAVEYYVSYYDYYQPETYLPITDLYVEKSSAINDEIDRLRLSAADALLSGKRGVITVSPVSCTYGMGGPSTMANSITTIKKEERLNRSGLLRKLVEALYAHNGIDLQRGNFRVRGDTVDITMAYSSNILHIT